MKRLSELVEIATNNEECVVLKVKENTALDMISLGCFDGDELMLRLTKGDTHTATIFRESHNESWRWGLGGYTLVSKKVENGGRLIQECIEEDFGIYMGKNRNRIHKTLHIKTLSDKTNMDHTLKIMYWPGKEHERCNIHKDGEHFKFFGNRSEARSYMKKHYEVKGQQNETAVTGCIVETYQVLSK